MDGKLQDGYPLAGDPVLPDLADIDRAKVGLSVGVGMGHEAGQAGR
jgi:hypothetical protein